MRSNPRHTATVATQLPGSIAEMLWWWDSTCGGRVGHGEGADPPGSSGTLPAHERDVVERLCGEIAGAFASDPSTSAGTVLSGGGGGTLICYE